MRTLSALAVFGFFLTTAGCGSDDGPRTPTAPVRPPVPEPTPSPPDPPTFPERMQLRFDGVFYAPGSVIELTPGAAVQIQVEAHPPTFYQSPDWIAFTPDWAAFTVETDAPPSVLRVGRWIERREVESNLPDTGESETRSVSIGMVERAMVESG